MSIIMMIVGIIFALTGTFCLANAGVTFYSLAFIIGIVMLIYGITAMITYFILKKKKNKYTFTLGWILIESILSILLSSLVLLNQLTIDATIPIFFGMWIMFSGILRVAAALFIRDIEKGVGWIWMLVIGVVGILMSLFSFVNPLVAGVSVISIVGMCCILQGINVFSTGLRLCKRLKYRSDNS